MNRRWNFFQLLSVARRVDLRSTDLFALQEFRVRPGLDIDK